MTAVVKFLIDRPLATHIVSIIVLMLGIFSFFQLKRQATPLVDLEQVRIVSFVPAASSKDIELNVTTKLEEALESVNGIEKHFSTSSEGRSTIEVFLDPDAADKEKIKSDIRRAIEGVDDLPEEMLKQPQVFEIKVEEIVVYELAIIFDRYDEKRIATTARELKREILKLDGVARVRYNGVPEREVKVLLNPKLMQRFQVSSDEIIHAIRSNKIRLGAGTLESFRAERGIITISDFDDPKELGEIILRSTSSGQSVRISDVARVDDSFAKQDLITEFNGQRGASLLIVKKSSADIIELVDRIEALKADYLRKTPDDLSLITTWDFSVNTRTRLDIVSSNFAAGFFLVLLVLFLFLDYRVAFWTACGIPIAIAAALTVMPTLDVSINSVSLCGVVLVLGMIVDDAIIIAESIYRQIEAGVELKEAALEGLSQVIKPVFGTIITSMIAFLPLYFLPGTIGDFSIEVPTVVNVMLAASFFEAVFILPAHLAHRKAGKGKARKLTPPGQPLIKFMEERYMSFLRFCLQHKIKSFFLISIVLIAGIAVALRYSGFRMFDLSQSYRIYMMGQVTKGSSLNFTKLQVERLGKIIERLPEGVVKTYKSTIGVEGSFKGARFNSHSSFLTEIVLTPFTERDYSAEAVASYIKDSIETEMSEVITGLDIEIDAEGPPVGRPLEIRITGDDSQLRHEIVQKIKDLLTLYPVSEITADNSDLKSEIHLLPDFERLAQLGLTVSQVANTLRTAFDGSVVGHLQTPVESVPFRVMLDPEFQSFEDPLQELLIRNEYGNMIPVKGIMKEKLNESPSKILHYNGYPSNLITANIDRSATANELYRKLQSDLSSIRNAYPSYSIEVGGEAKGRAGRSG